MDREGLEKVVEPASSLLLEEYKSCRELIGRNIEIMEKNEVFCLGACAVVFAFSLSATDPFVSVASSFLPVMISFLGSLRFYGLDDTIDKINDYLVSLEQTHEQIGWTKFYRDHNTKKVLKKTRYSFWASLFIVSLAFLTFAVFTSGAKLIHSGRADTPAKIALPLLNAS